MKTKMLDLPRTSIREQRLIERFVIPLAEKRANARVKRTGKGTEAVTGKDGVTFNWDFFTQYFHEEMDRILHRTRNHGTQN